MSRIYSLKRQRPDERDYSLKTILDVHPQVKLPKIVDLTNQCPPIYDQGNLGSCTANAGTVEIIMLPPISAIKSCSCVSIQYAMLYRCCVYGFYYLG